MIEALIFIKNSIYGLMVLLWGVLFLVGGIFFDNNVVIETIKSICDTDALGYSFVSIGLLYIISRYKESPLLYIISGIMVASIFMFIGIVELKTSSNDIGWMLPFLISIHQTINSYLVIRN